MISLKRIGLTVILGATTLFGCMESTKPIMRNYGSNTIESHFEVDDRTAIYYPAITQIVPVDEDSDGRIDYILYGTDDGRVFKEYIGN